MIFSIQLNTNGSLIDRLTSPNSSLTSKWILFFRRCTKNKESRVFRRNYLFYDVIGFFTTRFITIHSIHVFMYFFLSVGVEVEVMMAS